MLACQKACRAFCILSSALLLIGWISAFNRADEPNPQKPIKVELPFRGAIDGSFVLSPRQLVAFPDNQIEPTKIENAPNDAISSDKGAEGKKKEKQKDKETGKGFDPAVVSAGMAAFERSCTSCHSAARSLERTKDLAGWRATVRRMAAKRGAEVANDDIEPISVYLASRNSPASGGTAEKEKGDAPAATNDASSVSTFATLSPQWRGGNDHLQNSGFAPLAWVGANWQSKIVSARVTLCVSCHGVQEQAFLNRIDVVEAAARLDLSQFLEPCMRGLKGGIDAGRFVVPFGAFSSQTNPGLYRTVSTPLIFNMGQRVFNQDIGVPVLPMPYSDTGVNFNLDIPVGDLGTGPITSTIDSYLINGLAGSGNGIDFLQSRNLLDNNNHAAFGGRVTVGDPYIRAGASFMTGSFDDRNDLAVPSGPLGYQIYGFDVQARYKRLFRCQIEFARRNSDRVGVLGNGPGVFTERVDGYYLEAEVRPWDDCRVSFLARHDFLRSSSPLPPAGSTLTTGNFNVERITLGVNIDLWQQSLLMFNIEHWLVPERTNAVNVFGVRYVVSF
jgi:hypothetical protein